MDRGDGHFQVGPPNSTGRVPETRPTSSPDSRDATPVDEVLPTSRRGGTKWEEKSPELTPYTKGTFV